MKVSGLCKEVKSNLETMQDLRNQKSVLNSALVESNETSARLMAQIDSKSIESNDWKEKYWQLLRKYTKTEEVDRLTKDLNAKSEEANKWRKMYLESNAHRNQGMTAMSVKHKNIASKKKSRNDASQFRIRTQNLYLFNRRRNGWVRNRHHSI